METIKTIIEKWKNGTIVEVWETWKWILSYSNRYKKTIAFYLFLGIFSTVFSLISSIASKQLIDIVTGHRKDQMLIMAIVMISMALFSLIFSSVISRVSLKLTISIQNDIQADIFQKIQEASWLSISEYHSGDILNRFATDVGTVASNAITWLPSLVISLFNFIATFAVIMYYDVTMALISLASAPILLFVSQYLMGRMREYSKKVKEMNSQVMAFEQETFSNMNTIKAFGITARYANELKKWQSKYREFNLEYNMFSIKTNIALSLLGMVIQYASFGWGVYRLWSGHITYGEMTLFLSQGGKLSSAFNSLVGYIPHMLNSSVSAGRVLELVKLPREIHHEQESNQLREKMDQGFTVVLKDVFFRYVEDKTVLKESDFVAKPNEIVAIVGPSGEGKTTMLRLFLGLILPEKGSASLRDSKGNEVPMNADTRQFFSYVPQGNTIFSGTIADNLRLIKQDATDEEIIEALKIACAWDFVEKLPLGINSPVGEKGRGLSEGQSQRIAIARAVLRDAPIMLLDEATSALDVETERKVLRSIILKKPNKTCIVATHRPSVLTMCQRVYRVMDTKLTTLDNDEAARMSMDF
jgi:ABC-type bacteriocin/lantibiotic exporter with double-glycine peptidase domain